MNFNTGRLARLAGLLTEGAEKEEEDAVSETEEVDETDAISEAEETDEVDEADEAGIKEAYDVRRIVRDEIQKSLLRRDPNVAEYTSGQVFGKKNKQPTLGQVVFGFPGIGFKR